ncbi:MAG: hypothetical protein C4523_13425 [Myxococcales bacterium]|nr:MAG: hypothetical protein C4523_13425 [Myxococcales bacterium]
MQRLFSRHPKITAAVLTLVCLAALVAVGQTLSYSYAKRFSPPPLHPEQGSTEVGDVALPAPPPFYETPVPPAPCGDFCRPIALNADASERLPLTDLAEWADFFQDGLLLDAGSANFQKRADKHEWSGPSTLADGRTVQKLTKRPAAVDVWLPPADGFFIEVKATAGEPGQKLTLDLGGEAKATVVLGQSDWETYFADFRRFGDLSGYRRLTFSPSGTRWPTIDYVRIRPSREPISDANFRAPDAGLDAAPSFVRPVASAPIVCEEKALILPASGGAVFHLIAPAHTRLIWRTRVEREDAKRVEPISLRVAVAEDRLPARNLHIKVFGAKGGDERLAEAVDLWDYAGKPIRLELWAEGGHPGDRLVLLDAQIKNDFPPQLPTVWQPPKNVILFLSDTLRWDKIRFMKPFDNTIITPNFDSIASQGVAFRNAISQGNWSKPSQAAIMSGRYPWSINMETAKSEPTTDTLLIADAIEKARPDVVTGSYSSNGYVSDAFGFDQNWDYSRNMVRENLANRAEYLLKAMVPVWERDKNVEKPFFVWFGTVDAHVAYNPREMYLKLYDPEPYSGVVVPVKTAFLLLDIKQGKVQMSPRDWHRLKSLYNGSVTYNDYQFGRLLEQLRKWDILDETAVILISDHGDEFWEHKGTGHGHSLYDVLMRVPLVIYYPRGFPKPRVVEEAVETMGLYPAMLEMLGIAPSAKTQAKSLLPFALGIEPLWSPAAATRMAGSGYMIGVKNWRLILKGSRKMQLYDTSSDPYQHHDLIHERPLAMYFMHRRWIAWQREYRPD